MRCCKDGSLQKSQKETHWGDATTGIAKQDVVGRGVGGLGEVSK